MPILCNGNLRLLAPLLFLLSWPSCTRQQCLELTAREDTLRLHAVKRVMPEFPSEAQRDNATGVVVAQVHIDETGILRSVQVLQAPHPSIAQATSAAINQWVFDFHSNKTETPECFNGKLTFYFVIESGRAYVRDPKRFQNG